MQKQRRNHAVRQTNKDSNTKPVKPTTSSPEPWLAEIVLDELTGEAFLRVEFENGVHGRQTRLFDTDLSEDPLRLRKALKRAGASFEILKKGKSQFLEDLLRAIPDDRPRITNKPGFRRGGFVLGQKMFGKCVQDYRWKPEAASEASLGLENGTLSDWKKHVAAPLKQSRYGSFAVCIGLGACLPSYVDMHRLDNPGLPQLVSETMSFNFSGRSGTGKTTLEHIVAGLSGLPVLRNWDFTPASFEESAAACNNLVLVLDDTETYVGDQNLAGLIRMVNQRIPAGQSKARSKVSAGHSYYGLTWRTFGMSSSPKPIDLIAKQSGWERTQGEMVRYCDIAVPPPEKGGVFDALSCPKHERSARSSQLIGKLEPNCSNYHGTAMPAFVEYLLREDCSAEVVALVEKFVRIVKPTKAWETRYAKKFGVAYAAGKLAVSADILPWEDKWVFKAVCHCYRKALAGIAKDEQVLDGKVRPLQIAMTDPQQFPKMVSGKKKPIPMTDKTLGVRTTYRGRDVVALRMEGLKTLSGSKAGAKALLDHLDTVGVLVGGHGHSREIQLLVPIAVNGATVTKPRFYALDAKKLAAYGQCGE